MKIQGAGVKVSYYSRLAVLHSSHVISIKYDEFNFFFFDLKPQKKRLPRRENFHQNPSINTRSQAISQNQVKARYTLKRSKTKG